MHFVKFQDNGYQYLLSADDQVFVIPVKPYQSTPAVPFHPRAVDEGCQSQRLGIILTQDIFLKFQFKAVDERATVEAFEIPFFIY